MNDQFNWLDEMLRAAGARQYRTCKDCAHGNPSSIPGKLFCPKEFQTGRTGIVSEYAVCRQYKAKGV